MRKMIPREIAPKLLSLIKQFPVLALFGPRQSGKTTVAKALFPEYRYVNMESFEEQEFAQNDSKGFLERFKNEKGIILDEIQKAPKLLSYIQIEVDEKDVLGRFVLTGSQNILLNQQVSQTLAGRVALTTLLPLSIRELKEADALPSSFVETMFQGFYPRIYHDKVDPIVFAESYIRTYIERDVRDIKQIISLTDFQRFLRLCAGRNGQLLNMSSLATESGLSLPTVKSWLSILEASYIIFLLQPYHVNFNKRLVKMPKLYFYDTALVCSLLRLTTPDEVYTHYLRGGLFESMIISDLLKNRYNQTLPPNAYFWRDKTGHEIDCVLEEGQKAIPIEIKSTATVSSDLFDGLKKWAEFSERPLQEGVLIYGGEESQMRPQGKVVSWRDV
jgi:Predicted ATPase (AAA+ superfamily)